MGDTTPEHHVYCRTARLSSPRTITDTPEDRTKKKRLSTIFRDRY